MIGIDRSYLKTLKIARENNEAKDFRHLEGWKDIKKVTALGLYRQGKISIALAMRFNAKLPDHLAALESGKITLDDLIKAGVDLHRIESYRKQRETKTGILTAKIEQASRKIMASVIVRNGQVIRTVEHKQEIKKPSAQEIAVAVAVASSKAREKARIESLKTAKSGFEVKLSTQEQAELIARVNSKGQAIIK